MFVKYLKLITSIFIHKRLTIKMKTVFSLLLIFFSVYHTSSSNCQVPESNTFDLEIVSNSLTELIDSSSNYLGLATGTINCGWTSISNANWIWNKQYASNYETVYFRVRFWVYGVPNSGTMTVAVDDSVTITVNGITVGCSGTTYGTLGSCNINSALKSGFNEAIFKGYNKEGGGCLVFKIILQAYL